MDGPGEDRRLELYRVGRDFLLERGYEQLSMRMFRRTALPGEERPEGPVYCCQEDGMVGLGCGARSYTRSLHYSTEYAVAPGAVRSLIRDYSQRSEADFESADYGYLLDPEDQLRRYLIQSLLQAEGISLEAYRARFNSSLYDDLPEVALLHEFGLADESQAGRLQLSERGLERSDVIGPWLYSKKARERMERYEWR
jgi:oxygen-independent coproporphyrinogen-3 oxidase